MHSLEDPPKDIAHLAYKNGKGSLKDILRPLDKLYGRSALYVHLQLEICNIQQTYKESTQDYYEWLVRLQVAIQDKYPEHLHDLELERMAQEAFYNGLWEEYKPMVIHMLESPDMTIRDLLEAVRKIEAMNKCQCLQRIDATRYPPSMSLTYHRPTYGKDKHHDKDKKDHKDEHNGHSGGVITRCNRNNHCNNTCRLAPHRSSTPRYTDNYHPHPSPHTGDDHTVPPVEPHFTTRPSPMIASQGTGNLELSQMLQTILRENNEETKLKQQQKNLLANIPTFNGKDKKACLMWVNHVEHTAKQARMTF